MTDRDHVGNDAVVLRQGVLEVVVVGLELVFLQRKERNIPVTLDRKKYTGKKYRKNYTCSSTIRALSGTSMPIRSSVLASRISWGKERKKEICR